MDRDTLGASNSTRPRRNDVTEVSGFGHLPSWVANSCNCNCDNCAPVRKASNPLPHSIPACAGASIFGITVSAHSNDAGPLVGLAAVDEFVVGAGEDEGPEVGLDFGWEGEEVVGGRGGSGGSRGGCRSRGRGGCGGRKLGGRGRGQCLMLVLVLSWVWIVDVDAETKQ
jgi:hypothetical protein